jgi:poly(A) polymerase
MSYERNNLESLRTSLSLAEAPWLKDHGAAAVMLALNGGNQAKKALFVGGCVRDSVLGMDAGDVDIATMHRPPDVINILENKHIRTIPTGIAHGTVTALSGGKVFQITSLRKDVETFGRRAIVAFTNDWQEDALRRDFTMNTLLCDMQGAVYDPLGQGVHDAQAGIVRFVGDPETRIGEDYLRILRYFRFHARYGKGSPDKEAIRACKRLSGHVMELSRERITQEILKILADDRAADTIELMFANHVLRILSQGRNDDAVLRRLITMQKAHGMVEPISRLIVLAGFDGAQLGIIERVLILPRHEQFMLSACKDAIRAIETLDATMVRRLVYTYKNDVAARAVLLWAARYDMQVPDDLLAMARQWTAPVFPLTGADLKVGGIVEGPLMGQILSRVEAWWLARDMAPDKAACLHQALQG